MIFISLSAFSVSLRSLHLEKAARCCKLRVCLPYPLRSKERFHAIAKLFQHISSPAIETQTDTCEVDWNPRQSIPAKKTCYHSISSPYHHALNQWIPNWKCRAPTLETTKDEKHKFYQILRFPAHSKSPLPGRWWPFPELCMCGVSIPFSEKQQKWYAKIPCCAKSRFGGEWWLTFL